MEMDKEKERQRERLEDSVPLMDLYCNFNEGSSLRFKLDREIKMERNRLGEEEKETGRWTKRQRGRERD